MKNGQRTVSFTNQLVSKKAVQNYKVNPVDLWMLEK